MFQHVDMESALRRLAERRIEEAMREGKFENLEGAGKPLDLEDPPADEEARLLWWALRIMRQHDVIPDEVRLRKAIDGLRLALTRATTEGQVREAAGRLNEAVRRLNTMGTTRIDVAVSGVDVEVEVQRFRQTTDQPQRRRDAETPRRREGRLG